MTPEDEAMAKSLVKRWRKDKRFKFFIASKRGGNARGIGANRSVILASYGITTDKDGKEIGGSSWFQLYKVWGENNEQRARRIVIKANQLIQEELKK